MSAGKLGPVEVSHEVSQLVCGVAIASERLRDHLDRDGPQITDVVPDSGLQFGQNEAHIGLVLRGSGLGTQVANAFF